MWAIYVFLMLLSVAMVFERSIISCGNVQSIWNHFTELEQLFSQRIPIKMNYREFNQQYALNIFLIFLCFSSLVAIKLFYRFNGDSADRQIGVLILHLFALLSIAQILFYVSFFNHVLLSINRHIIKIVENYLSNRFIEEDIGTKLMEQFQLLKIIHFKLWQIIELINSDFGAITAVLILEKSNQGIQTFYWIIIDMCEDDLYSDWKILSKKNFFFFNSILM